MEFKIIGLSIQDSSGINAHKKEVSQPCDKQSVVAFVSESLMYKGRAFLKKKDFRRFMQHCPLYISSLVQKQLKVVLR